MRSEIRSPASRATRSACNPAQATSRRARQDPAGPDAVTASEVSASAWGVAGAVGLAGCTDEPAQLKALEARVDLRGARFWRLGEGEPIAPRFEHCWSACDLNQLALGCQINVFLRRASGNTLPAFY